MSELKLRVVDTNRTPWDLFEVPHVGHKLPSKTLFEDPETGMLIVKVVYRAGHNTPPHWHRCSHGIYVLDGILTTHDGDYGPGTFVWFPEGMTMEHGAGPETDCTYLFITNKAFSIHFTHVEGGPPPRA